MNRKYIYPVVRYGIICDSPEKLDPETADIIQGDIIKKWDNIKEGLVSRFGDAGIKSWRLSEEELKDKGLFLEDFEGPAVLFEHMGIGLNGFDGEFRSSITVCYPPNHSKIWMRYSFKPDNNGEFELSRDEIKNFDNKALKASNKIEDLFIEGYDEVLNRHNLYGLKKVHTILIKTVASNDKALKEFIDRILSSRKLEEKEMETVLCDPFYWLDDKNVEFIGYSAENNSIKYFGLSTNIHKGNIHEGIFIKYATDELTDFAGIGYAPDYQKLKDYRDSVSHNIGKALIRSISPSI